MPPIVAVAACSVLVLALFWLDRDNKARTSIGLWLPTIWIALACSRTVSQWISFGGFESTAQVEEGSPLDRLIYTGLLIVGLIVLSTRGKRVSRILQANKPILLFFGYCAISMIWSDFPGIAFKRWIKALGDLVMLVIILTERDPYGAFKRVMARVSYVLIPFSIVMIKYYPDIGTSFDPWGGKVHYTGVTTNKNTLGVLCMSSGLVALWRLINLYKDRQASGRTRHMVALGTLLAIALWLFIHANSMTSMNCFLMAVIVILTTNFWSAMRRPGVVHLVIASMVIVSASVLFLGIGPILQMMGRNPTLTERTDVWGVLLTLVQNPILGTGFESFWLGPRLERLWTIYWWQPNEAHNGYLEVYLNLGWVGIGLLGFVLAAGYRAVASAYRRNQPMSNLRLAFFVVGIAFNFTEAAFFKMLAPAWIFFLFAIITVPGLSSCEPERAAPRLQEDDPVALIHELIPASLREETV